MSTPIAINNRAPCPANAEGCVLAPMGRFDDRSGKFGTVEILRCIYCGVGISMPPLPDVAFLYEGRESQDFQPSTGGLARAIKRFAFTRQARALLRALPETPNRALDFACGSGLFTRCLGEVLPVGAVTGSDFHSDPPAEIAGYPYLPLALLDEHVGQFDLVLAMHVLEHDDDAAGLLRRIAAMLRPGGTLVVEVPNIDCCWAPVFGRHWDAWYLPFHRTHFSRTSLNALLVSAGLALQEERAICLPSMGRSLANVLRLPHGLPMLLAGIVLHPLQWLGERLTGRPSALRVIAIHPAE